MEFNALIQNRESIRDYDPNKAVSEAVLTRILNAGRLAPSASNRQPWRFVLVSSPEILKQIHECYDRDWFKKAPHVLVVVADRSLSWKRSYDAYDSIETDAAIAMDHMILAAENEAVGACWIIAYDKEKLIAAIGLKKNEEVFCITPLGYPHDGFKKKQNKIRKSLEEIVTRL